VLNRGLPIAISLVDDFEFVLAEAAVDGIAGILKVIEAVVGEAGLAMTGLQAGAEAVGLGQLVRQGRVQLTPPGTEATVGGECDRSPVLGATVWTTAADRDGIVSLGELSGFHESRKVGSAGIEQGGIPDCQGPVQ